VCLSLNVGVFLIVCLPQCCVSISSVCVYLRMFVSLSQCVCVSQSVFKSLFV